VPGRWAALFAAIGRFAYRHRLAIVLVWLAAFLPSVGER
jgi:uncharacterized membrane protein YdfJ with MMPL/SSD domain